MIEEILPCSKEKQQLKLQKLDKKKLLTDTQLICIFCYTLGHYVNEMLSILSTEKGLTLLEHSSVDRLQGSSFLHSSLDIIDYKG